VPCYIINIARFDNFWLICDANGKIIRFELSENKKDYDTKTIKVTNSGKFLDVAVSPVSNCSITIGEDGAVRLWDYVNSREFYNR